VRQKGVRILAKLSIKAKKMKEKQPEKKYLKIIKKGLTFPLESLYFFDASA
jgi:hypothetical protein